MIKLNEIYDITDQIESNKGKRKNGKGFIHLVKVKTD